MGTDTLRFGGYSFEIKEVFALPTKNELIVYENDRVHIILGYEKFVWVRNGFNSYYLLSTAIYTMLRAGQKSEILFPVLVVILAGIDA